MFIVREKIFALRIIYVYLSEDARGEMINERGLCAHSQMSAQLSFPADCWVSQESLKEEELQVLIRLGVGLNKGHTNILVYC